MFSSVSTGALLLLVALFGAASGSVSFAGSNNYYLHGLSAQDQTEYIQGLQSAGAKVVRLWGKMLL